MKKRVLFVDDEPRILDMFRRILREHSQEWEMSFAISVDEALAFMEGTEFDTIVTDISMPGKDGFEFLRILRGSSKTMDVPVVILTGNAEKNLKRIALDSGAADLLNKPVDPEDLVSRIRSVLRLKEYQDEIKSQKETLEQKVRERTRELERSRLEIIWRLAKAGEYRDNDTGEHVVRVGWYCRVLAEAIGADDGFVHLVSLTSPLHDIGKIGITDGILLKPGKLTPEERKIMEQHCAIGAQILRERPRGVALPSGTGTFASSHRGTTPARAEGTTPAQGEDAPDTTPAREDAWEELGNPLLSMASSIAMGHHERWDAKGYPAGIGGEGIPLEARIVALADVYDALCSVRPYKPAFSHERALEIMCEEEGHFDPNVFRTFEGLAERFQWIRKQFDDSPPS